jgi:acyl-CoA oxidase
MCCARAWRQVAWMRRQYYALLTVLRQDAVGLVDAFGLSDYLLNSALGRFDGDVYRALLAAAQGSPLNQTQEGPAWDGILKPLLVPRPRL